MSRNWEKLWYWWKLGRSYNPWDWFMLTMAKRGDLWNIRNFEVDEFEFRTFSADGNLYRRYPQFCVSGDLATQLTYANTEATPYWGDMSKHGYPLTGGAWHAAWINNEFLGVTILSCSTTPQSRIYTCKQNSLTLPGLCHLMLSLVTDTVCQMLVR